MSVMRRDGEWKAVGTHEDTESDGGHPQTEKLSAREFVEIAATVEPIAIEATNGELEKGENERTDQG